MNMIEKIRVASHAEDPTYDSDILQGVLFGTLLEEELHYFCANASENLQTRLIEAAALMDCTFDGSKPIRFNDFEDAVLPTYNHEKANRSWADLGARFCASQKQFPEFDLQGWSLYCYKAMFDVSASPSYRIMKCSSFLATLDHINTEDYMEILEEVHRKGVRIHTKYILRSVLGLD